MHYLDRLIERALALPRDQTPELFDPFEQQGLAPLEAPTPAAPRIADPPSAIAGTPAPMTSPLEPPPSGSVPAAAAAHVTFPVPESPVRATDTAVASSDDVAVQALAPTVPVAVQATPDAARPRALDHADAFMQALGAKLPATALPTAPRAPQRTPSELSRIRATPSIVSDRPAVVASRHPLLLPPRPRAVAMQPAAPRSAARAAEAAAPRRPVAESPRRSAPPPTERIVQTTVVGTSSARRLDDLARSSAISRFGLGQS